jgi:hypothetical protein
MTELLGKPTNNWNLNYNLTYVYVTSSPVYVKNNPYV